MGHAGHNSPHVVAIMASGRAGRGRPDRRDRSDRPDRPDRPVVIMANDHGAAKILWIMDWTSFNPVDHDVTS